MSTTVTEQMFSVGELRDIVERMLTAWGAQSEVAATTGSSLATANRLGHDSHGVIRLLEYSGWVTTGQIRPREAPDVRLRSGAVAVVDGRWGFGQPAARLAGDVAIELAQAHGIGAVAVASCNHVGRLGEYVQQIADARCVGIAFCNSGPVVAPLGGTRRTFGTNPMAWAAPRSGGDPLVLDFSTAASAEGKVKMALMRGQQVAEGVLVDSAGRPSNEPADLYAGGALLPFGGHKGSGLSLMIELTGGLLSGMGTSPMPDFAGGNGALLTALSIEAFTAFDDFTGRAGAFADRVRTAPDGSVEPDVLLPGQLEFDTGRQRDVGGVPVPDSVRREITVLGDRYELDLGTFELR